MTFHSFISLTVTLFRVCIGHIVGHSILGVEDKTVAFYFLYMRGLHWHGKVECQSNAHHRHAVI